MWNIHFYFACLFTRLNEGHTVFVERKIISRLHGGEPLRTLLASEGWKALQETVSCYKEDLYAIQKILAVNYYKYSKKENAMMIPFPSDGQFQFGNVFFLGMFLTQYILC